MASIELQNVTVKIGNNILLDNVSLKVDDGAYIGLLGPSNGGPSFVLKVIAGLLPIYSGKIFIDEVDVTDSHPEDRNVGFIFEQFNLFPHLTVLDNILYGPRVKGIDLTTKEREAKEVISMVRLENRESALSKELSGGMQQRTGIARAITAGAKILLLDQPYRALDAKIREEMRFEIRELVKELGMTAIHSTHETEEAMLTSDKIAVFNEGKLLQFDNPETVYKIPVNAFVAGFLAESNKFQVKVKDNSFIIENSKFIVDGYEDGEYVVIIRQIDVDLTSEPLNVVNEFECIIDKIRILGEFIRFTVTINNSLTIIVRELLSLERNNVKNLIGKRAYVNFRPDLIKLFLV